jgi:asparagine synthase (glutamine-hydrolysing)
VAGIAGIIRRDGTPVDRASVEQMCTALRHRGPDGERYRAFSSRQAVGGSSGAPPNVLLASRYFGADKAANTDLPADQTGTLGISFDGHLDNYHELRSDLERAGCSFQSREPAELVLHLYKQESDDWLEQLDGAFAFALWDGLRKRLLLVRDRLGRKPLYYADSGRALIFASEVKALLASGLIRAALHPESLAECFTFQNNYGRETLFRGVRLVLPGTMIVSEGDRIEERRWFTLQVVRNAGQGDFDDCARELGELLQDSVKSQLEAGRSTGVYLSGGIDSGAIAALASRHAQDLHTFTCGFEMADVDEQDAGIDEREHAERIAARYQTCHFSRTIRPGDMARILPKLIHCQEELRLGMTYQNFYAAQLASKFVSVALGGIGGDELFAGYPWRNGPAARCKSRAEFDTFCNNTYQRLVPESEWNDLFSAAVRRDIGDFSARDTLNDVFSDTDPDDDFLHRDLLFEMRTSLHAQLVLEDKIQMAFSTDYRTPLLSNRVLEFALSVPGAWKLGDQNGKLVYRRAVDKLLPADLLSAKKQGFCPPDRSWLRRLTMPYVREILFSPRALERNVFQRDFVERTLIEHERGSADRRLLIWSFLCFEWWSRIWLDGDDVADT